MTEYRDRRRNTTVGIVLSHFEETCQSLILPGIIDYANTHHIRLILFNSATLNERYSFNVNYNMISSFVSSNNIDALVLMSGAMGNLFSRKDIEEFADHLSPLPMVSIAMSLDGIPSILINNKTGIHEIVHHLIEVHHYRRIAFVKGPVGHEEADERFNAYKEALSLHGIDFDPNLVAPGDFSTLSGRQAVHRFFDEAKEAIDAIIAVDDHTACGVLAALNERGIKVLDHLAVTGFDDSIEASSSIPPLTTVRQPFYEVGKKSIQLVIDMLQGNQVPQSITLPTQMVIRESCSCFSSLLSKVSKPPESKSILPFKPGSYPSTLFEGMVLEILKEFDEVSTTQSKFKDCLHQLLISLSEDLYHTLGNEAFLRGLREALYTFLPEGSSVVHWHNALSVIRNLFLQEFGSPHTLRSMEYLLHKARVLIDEVNITIQKNNESQIYLNNWLLRQVSQKLIVSFDLATLLEVVEEAVNQLKIPKCFIVLYDSKVKNAHAVHWSLPEYSRLVFAYTHNEKIPLDEEGLLFHTKDILPPFKDLRNDCRTCLFMPLFFKDEHFGYILFEYGSLDKNIYETLRCHVSSALKGALLYSERADAERELKQAMQNLECLNTELKNISTLDELTLLYNRRGFFEAAEPYFCHAKKTKQPFVLFFIDLDGLKHINDTFGHKEGDAAILHTADIIKHSFRKSDIMARLGGDEFTILVMDTRAEDVDHLQKKIEKSLDNFNSHCQNTYLLSMSIGHAVFDGKTDCTLEQLMIIADKSLYREKRMKKQCPVCEDS